MDARRHSGKLFGACCLLIALLGLFLRFWKLPEQGLFFYDEAWYSLVAQTYLLLPQWFGLMTQGVSGQEAFARVYDWGFYPQIGFKPVYMFALMIAKLLTGIRNPAAGQYLSAVLGWICIWAVYKLLANYTRNRWIALAGALLTAVSGLEVSYSRMVFPHQLAALLLLGYIHLYLKRLEKPNIGYRREFLIGMFAGSLLPAHDMMLPIVGLLALFESGFLLWQYYRTKNVRASISAVMAYFGGIVTPLLLCQLLTVALREFFRDTLGKRYVTPYFKEVFGHVTAHHVTGHKVLTESDYLYFIKALLHTEGILFLLLIGLGFIALVIRLNRERHVRTLFITTITVACVGLISIYPSKVLRLVVPFMPLLIVTAAIGLGFLANIAGKRQTKMAAGLTALLMLAVVWQPMQYSGRFTQLKSGFPAASRDIAALCRPGEALATPYNFPLYTIYLQRKVYGFKSRAELAKLVRERRVRYVAYDFEQLYKLPASTPTYISQVGQKRIRLLATEESLQNSFLKAYPNPARASFMLLLESHYSQNLARELMQRPDRYNLDRIRLYTPLGPKY